MFFFSHSLYQPDGSISLLRCVSQLCLSYAWFVRLFYRFFWLSKKIENSICSILLKQTDHNNNNNNNCVMVITRRIQMYFNSIWMGSFMLMHLNAFGSCYVFYFLYREKVLKSQIGSTNKWSGQSKFKSTIKFRNIDASWSDFSCLLFIDFTSNFIWNSSIIKAKLKL